jgi:hypothetical protein
MLQLVTKWIGSVLNSMLLGFGSFYEGLTIIGDSAFEGCSSLESIVLPSNVKLIGDNVFKDCAKLVNIELPEGLAVMGSYAFKGCSSL